MIGRMFPPQGYGVEIEPYDYCIFTDNDGYIKAKNGRTGRIEFSGTDAATVVQNAINAMRDGGLIVLIGNFTFNSSINILKRIVYRHYGTMTLNVPDGEAGFVIGSSSIHLERCNIFVEKIDGVNKAKDGIKILNGANNYISIDRVHRCRYAFYIKQESENVGLSENIFRYNMVSECKKGLYIPAPPSGQAPAGAEGTQLLGGAMFANDEHGVLIENGANAGGLYITGVIDNAFAPGSMDYVNYMDSSKLGSTLCLKFIREDYCVFHPNDIILNPSTKSVSVGSAGSLRILPDINIEREGTNTFRTYNTFVLRGTAKIANRKDSTTVEIFDSQITGEPHRRFIITADGNMYWGPGTAGWDVVLYRVATDLLSLGASDGLRVPGAIRTFVKAGAPTDSDIPSPEDGAIVIDSANNRLWVRVNGVWKYVSLT